MKNLLPIAIATLLAAPAAAQSTANTTSLISKGPVVITAEDFEASLLRAPENLRLDMRVTLERVAQSTDNLFVNRLLAEDAKRAGLLNDPLLRKRTEQVLEGFQARVWLDNFEKTAKIPGLEARALELYTSERERFRIPERYEVEHILVNLWGRTKDMALERTKEARRKIASGTDFLAVAREFSDDPGLKVHGGKLGNVGAANLDPAIGTQLPKLKLGEVSEPIQSRAGWHLVRVLSTTPARYRSFDEVKEELMDDERTKVLKRLTEEKYQALRNAPDVKVDVEAMKRLVREIPKEDIDRAHRSAAAPPTAK